MTVTIDEVSTGDTTPTTAPFKVSAVTGYTTATAKFTVGGTGPVRAYRMKRGGSAVINGVELARVGAVCNLTRCGDGTGPTAIATPKQFTEPVDVAELGGVDGDVTVNLYVYRASTFE